MKAVVFDLDGTLLDTIGDIANSMNYALKCYDIPPCTEDEVKSFVGNGLKMALARAIAKKAVKSVDENDQNLMFSLMENYYHKHPIEKTKPYDGIPMLLSLLDKSGVPYGVLSNKDDDLAKMIIPHFFPSHPFLFVRGKRKGGKLKPDYELLSDTLKPFGIKDGEALFVGDSEVDYIAANNYSSKSLIVTYGFRERRALEKFGIENLSDSVSELREKIFSLF